jgi:predicted glycosyltransferase
VWRYDGFKEEVYLHELEPDPGVPARLGISEEQPFVVARPSPRGATYHQHGNPVFDQAVRELVGRTDAKVVMIARRDADLAPYLDEFGDRVVAPSEPVDGPSLLFFARALVGAGGTMNREAALLGTPVVSLYAGALGAVDRRLIEQGRVHRVARDASDLGSLLERVVDVDGDVERPVLDSHVLDSFVEAILEPVARRRTSPAAVTPPAAGSPGTWPSR